MCECLYIVLVVFRVFNVVPVCPKFSEVFQMIEVFKLSDLVDCDVKCLELEVVLKSLNLVNLILLQVEFLEVY